MIYGLWQSAGGLQAQEYLQAIIANNLANAETPGFKPDRIAFQERLNASLAKGTPGTRHPVLDGMTGGVFETQVYTDFNTPDTAVIPSNSSFDVAIHGGGFFMVQTPDGPRYTRDGRLTTDQNGTLVQAATGSPVTDEQGQSIALDPSSGVKVRIDSTGVVRQGENIAGRLAVVDFADRNKLQKVGQNLYLAEDAVRTPAQGEIKQNCYESSGVDPVSAMVNMIAATRAYEINARMITMQDETLEWVVNGVGRMA
jgi:flagellar basal-body rod protein FlgF